MRRYLVVATLVGLELLSNLSCMTLVQPSPLGSLHAILTVRVLARTSEIPLPETTVRHDGQFAGWTDAQGILLLTITPDQETTIRVDHVGYDPMEASASPGLEERWTFYLEAR